MILTGVAATHGGAATGRGGVYRPRAAVTEMSVVTRAVVAAATATTAAALVIVHVMGGRIVDAVVVVDVMGGGIVDAVVVVDVVGGRIVDAIVVVDVVVGAIVGSAAAARIRSGVVGTATTATAVVTNIVVRPIVGSATTAEIAGCIVATAALADVTGGIVGTATRHGGGRRTERRDRDEGGERNLGELAHVCSPLKTVRKKVQGADPATTPRFRNYSRSLEKFVSAQCFGNRTGVEALSGGGGLALLRQGEVRSRRARRRAMQRREGNMIDTRKAALLACAAAMALPGTAWADEPAPSADKQTAKQDSDPGVWRISTGINYSQGDYGDTQDTKVVSVPVAMKYRKGGFSFRVSVPYVHIEGPGSLIDTPQGRDGGFADGGGSGSDSSGSNSGSGSSGSGSSGSGSSGSGSSGSGSSGSSGSGSSGSSGASGSTSSTSTGGSTIVPTGGAASKRSGIGDVAITLGYSFDLAETTYLDFTGRVKLPTASTAKRLGTGKADFTIGADLVQDIGDASIYVGGRRKFTGKPTGSTLRDVWGFGGGLSYAMEGGTIIGADYDWQQGSSIGSGPSSEVTGWVNFRVSRKLRLQVFASTGFNTQSTDFATGLTLSYRLN